jgi:hypothetical protein
MCTVALRSMTEQRICELQSHWMKDCLLSTQPCRTGDRTHAEVRRLRTIVADVRNGILKGRDRGPKWPHSRRLKEQRPRQSEILADMSLTSRCYCECLLSYTTIDCAWWGQHGSNCQLPTQSPNRSLMRESGTKFFDAEATRRNRQILPQFLQPVIEPVGGIIAQVSG